MTEDEIAVMDGGKCILQLRGVRPFFSDKFDITKHPKYKYLSDADPKNAFDMEKHLKRRPAIVKPDEVLTITRLTQQTYRRTQTMRKRSAEEKQNSLNGFNECCGSRRRCIMGVLAGKGKRNTAVLQRVCHAPGAYPSTVTAWQTAGEGTGEAFPTLPCGKLPLWWTCGKRTPCYASYSLPASLNNCPAAQRTPKGGIRKSISISATWYAPLLRRASAAGAAPPTTEYRRAAELYAARGQPPLPEGGFMRRHTLTAFCPLAGQPQTRQKGFIYGIFQ